MTHPLARWLAVASFAWLTLAPTAFRILIPPLPTAPAWQQICTAHADGSALQDNRHDRPSAPQHSGPGGDCPLCVLCHHGWAPAPAAVPVALRPQGRSPWLGTVPLSPRPASNWVAQNPRAPPAFS